ncbi:MAG: HigA family addiction module antidote protein, partial [Armatimonadetes bacterium]|nr:HigA family addiction module antidote protein [Armatimonadota bacterium]
MATRARQVRAVRAVPPGDIIRRELEARGWTQQELAEIMDRPLAALNQIIGGRKQITANTATELGRAFGTSAELWLNLETAYRLSLTRTPAAEERLKGVEERSVLREAAPCLGELTKRGWLPSDDGSRSLTERLLAYFGVDSLEGLRSPQLAAAFRRSPTSTADQVTLAAYARRVELCTEGQVVADYSREGLEQNVAALLALTRDAGAESQVPHVLRELGVRFVVVPTLPGAKIDGVTLHRPSGPIVALSRRLPWLDSFWFTLLHEVGHIVLGHTEDRVEEDLKLASDDPVEQ